MKFYKIVYRIIALVVLCLGIAVMPFLRYMVKSDMQIKENIYVIYLFYLVNTVVSYLYTYKRSILIADQKNYKVSVVQITSRIFQDLFQIAILIFTKNFILYLFTQILFTVVFNVVVSRIADKDYPLLLETCEDTLEADDKRNMSKNIRALMVRKVGEKLVSSTDNIIISSVLGIISTALISNYTLISTVLNTFLTQIFTGLTASIGNVNAVEKKEKKLSLFWTVNLVNFWLYGWVAIGFIVVGTDVVSLAFGSSYVLQKSICMIMGINFYTYGMQNVLWAYRNTLGVFHQGKYISIATGAINVVLSIFLGKYMGLSGVLLATFFARLLTNIWYEPYSIFRYGFEENAKRYYVRYILMGVIVTVTYFLTEGCVTFLLARNHFSFYGGLAIKMGICILIPNLIFMICFFKSAEFQYLSEKTKKIFGRLRKR